jgi:hypothetical protein
VREGEGGEEGGSEEEGGGRSEREEGEKRVNKEHTLTRLQQYYS